MHGRDGNKRLAMCVMDQNRARNGEIAVGGRRETHADTQQALVITHMGLRHTDLKLAVVEYDRTVSAAVFVIVPGRGREAPRGPKRKIDDDDLPFVSRVPLLPPIEETLDAFAPHTEGKTVGRLAERETPRSEMGDLAEPVVQSIVVGVWTEPERPLVGGDPVPERARSDPPCGGTGSLAKRRHRLAVNGAGACAGRGDLEHLVDAAQRVSGIGMVRRLCQSFEVGENVSERLFKRRARRREAHLLHQRPFVRGKGTLGTVIDRVIQQCGAPKLLPSTRERNEIVRILAAAAQ